MSPTFRNQLYLCLDQGGHATRAYVFNHDGELQYHTSKPVTTLHPGEDKVEYDAGEMLASFHQCLDTLQKEFSDRLDDIVSVGLASQRANMVCWDKFSGHALSPILSWQDRRDHEWLEKLMPQREAIHRKTGLFLSAHYGASKMRWCLHNIPSVQKAAYQDHLCMAPMTSFIVHHLCEERPFIVDPVSASRTQLYSLQDHNWDPELLGLYAIKKSYLPQIVPTYWEFGHLRVGNKRIPLKLVNGDQSAALYAFGKLQPDTAYINMGTGAFVSRTSGLKARYGRRLLTSLTYQAHQQDNYVLEGTVNGAGSALQWFKQLTGASFDLHELDQWLTDIEQPTLFLNGISGLGAPFWQPEFESRFIGDGSLEENAVAVIESILFLLKSSIDEMRKLSSPPEQIQVSGGLASMDGLCQKLADLTGLPVYRPSECEATARGTAYLLAQQPSYWPEQQEGEWFYNGKNEALCNRYQQWLDALLTQLRQH